MVDFRRGMDAETGLELVGFAHVQQSVRIILGTFFDEMPMLLDFGSELVRQIGRNMTAPVLAVLYRDAVAAIHRWEPEYRIRRIRIPALTRGGSVSIETGGTYFPEGRLGNFAIEQLADATFVIPTRIALGRAA